MRYTVPMATLLTFCLAARLCAQQAVSHDVVRSTPFDSSLHVALDSARRLPSGVYVLDLAEGAGSPISTGRPITMRFAAWLPSGKLIQPTSDEQEYLLGSGAFVEGFEKGIVGMKVGGKRRLLIPPQLGYGDRDTGQIPANSVLILDVTVVAQR